jgi:hypothetical protein
MLLPRGDVLEHGTVIDRNCDQAGNLVGYVNVNSLSNTRKYQVKYPDGCIQEHLA